MRIVVSEINCLIDLNNVTLLEAFLKLPYEVVVPNTLVEDALVGFTNAHKSALIHEGLKIVDLPGEIVIRAQQIVHEFPQLSVHDGLAFALAQSHRGCILLTGYNHLRPVARMQNIIAHGILWVIDEIYRHRLSTPTALHEALLLLTNNQAGKLPQRKLAAQLKRYGDLR